MNSINNDSDLIINTGQKRKSKPNIQSCVNLSQGGHFTPTTPGQGGVNFENHTTQNNPTTSTNQKYSKALLKIFKTVNKNKIQDLKQDSQFTRTCTKIPSLNEYNFSNFQSGINQKRSNSQNVSTPQSQGQNISTPIMKEQKYNINQNYSQNNNNQPQSPFNNHLHTVNTKDIESASLERKERLLSHATSKYQLFQTYQSAISSKRQSIGGGKGNWMNFQTHSKYRSTNGSMTSKEQMLPEQNLPEITIELKGSQVEIGSKQCIEPSTQKTINSTTGFNKQADDTFTPTSCNTLNSKQYINSPSKGGKSKQNISFNPFLSNIYTKRYKEMNLKCIEKNYQISSFNDYVKLENQQKNIQNEQLPQNNSQLSAQEQFKQRFHSSIELVTQPKKEDTPLSPKEFKSISNIPASAFSMSNLQTLHEIPFSQYPDKKSPAVNSVKNSFKNIQYIKEQQLNETSPKNKSQQRLIFQLSVERAENNQQNGNKIITKQGSSKANGVNQNSISSLNRSSPKFAFKKTQIFQTNKEVKTKEIKVYDDTLKMQRPSSRGVNSYEFIQLPFYRKKVIVVTDSNADYRSIRMTTNEKVNTDTSYTQKTKNALDSYNPHQYAQLPMDQFVKCSEFISSSTRDQPEATQSSHAQFFSPLSNFRYHQEVDFKNNLEDRQINELVLKQREYHLKKGVNMSKIKQAFKQTQSDTIMGLISPENRYQTNRYSKHYQKYISTKQ